jgi:REP element-mobilizing transposase RayT
MANTYSQLYLHLVFSTKNRKKLISPEIEIDIWAGIEGCARKHKMVALQVGGIENHAHALVSVPTILSASDVAKFLKGDSSLWIHRHFKDLQHFAWQDGYGVFSVSKSAVPDVIDYIQKQRDHHKKQTFEDEYIALLNLHEIDYDERYVFD